MARALAQECGVLCLPGAYFGPGQDRHLRIAFANAATRAIESMQRRLPPLMMENRTLKDR